MTCGGGTAPSPPATFSDSTTMSGGYAGDINDDEDDDFDSFFKVRTKLGENKYCIYSVGVLKAMNIN
jgi:hypothetical protein